MTAGHLQEKKGNYYIVLNYIGKDGKRKNKWIPTGLPVKGNKKRAEEMLMEKRRSFIPPERRNPQEDMLFTEFLEDWLDIVKPTIALTTFASYQNIVEKSVMPYFEEREILLRELRPMDLQRFYMKKLETVKASSVIHYHSVLHRALKYAVRNDLIPTNPADKVDRPKKERFVGGFYDDEEIQKLFEVAKGTKLEIPVFLGAFYGLRRSEILGLKWKAIDFEQNTITIQHTVTWCRIDGESRQVIRDMTKSKSSLRTLPLTPVFKEKLIRFKAQQEEYQRVCGKCYCKDYLEYICVDQLGQLIKPNYVTTAFRKLLKKNNLRIIRFHDLRHSCASLLLANGVSMKEIQEWLGHSDFSTTANIYAHLDYSSKISSAEAMATGLKDALDTVI